MNANRTTAIASFKQTRAAVRPQERIIQVQAAEGANRMEMMRRPQLAKTGVSAEEAQGVLSMCVVRV